MGFRPAVPVLIFGLLGTPPGASSARRPQPGGPQLSGAPAQRFEPAKHSLVLLGRAAGTLLLPPAVGVGGKVCGLFGRPPGT